MNIIIILANIPVQRMGYVLLVEIIIWKCKGKNIVGNSIMNVWGQGECKWPLNSRDLQVQRYLAIEFHPHK